MGGQGGQLPTQVFCRWVNPISTRGARLCPTQYYLPTQLSVASYAPDCRRVAPTNGQNLWLSTSRWHFALVYFIAFKQQEAHFSQFSGPSFFLSFCFHSRERIENTKSKGSKGLSCHDLQVDERVRVQSSGNFGQFEFFSTLWHSTE